MENYIIYNLYDYGPFDNTKIFKVGKGEVFVLGDNRDNSNDSRVKVEDNGIGMVSVENIVAQCSK